MPWSDDARVMARPFRTYAELASHADETPARTTAARVGLLLFFIGAFVSLTAAGRLVAFHVASSMIFWAFVPAIQAGVFAAVLRAVGGEERPRTAAALALYFAGHGPWMLLFVVVSGICLFAPDVYATMVWLLGHGILPAMLLGSWIWSGVLTFACFRAGLGLSRPRAGAATALFYVGYSGAIVGYYLLMNQIQPQVPWAR